MPYLELGTAEVKNQLPEARDQETFTLQNDIPHLLDDIIANLDRNQSNQGTHESSDHGRIRLPSRITPYRT